MIDVNFFEAAAQEPQSGLNVAILDEQSEITEIEVEELLGKVHALEDCIAREQQRRDAFQNFYRMKIAKAEEIFQSDTKFYRERLAALTETLRRYTEANITGKRKSIKFPSGTLSLTKQAPHFFIGGDAITNDNPKLIEIARRIDDTLVATKEFAKWGELKKQLTVDGTAVYVTETGEVVPELKARTEPDKFTIDKA